MLLLNSPRAFFSNTIVSLAPLPTSPIRSSMKLIAPCGSRSTHPCIHTNSRHTVNQVHQPASLQFPLSCLAPALPPHRIRSPRSLLHTALHTLRQLPPRAAPNQTAPVHHAPNGVETSPLCGKIPRCVLAPLRRAYSVTTQYGLISGIYERQPHDPLRRSNLPTRHGPTMPCGRWDIRIGRGR
jgi:hypothetical protein